MHGEALTIPANLIKDDPVGSNRRGCLVLLDTLHMFIPKSATTLESSDSSDQAVRGLVLPLEPVCMRHVPSCPDTHDREPSDFPLTFAALLAHRRCLFSHLLVSNSLLLSDTNVVLVALLAQIDHIALLVVCQPLALPLGTQVDVHMQPGEIIHQFRDDLFGVIILVF